ncbi:hypothetical protein HK096_002302 [Nowakowskiella sp. JEL0078]|nr:hypothetical protein HK096_002302 [Nowakowskiella sp. JEL0078]
MRSILFISDGHLGQINAIFAIAVSFWNNCDKENTKIVVACLPQFLSKQLVEESIPGAIFIELITPPHLAEETKMSSLLSPPRDSSSLITVSALLLDTDYYFKCRDNLDYQLVNLKVMPDFAVIDALSFNIFDSLEKFNIPYAVNYPFPSHDLINASLLSNWSYPSASSGLPLKMTLYERFLSLTWGNLRNFSMIKHIFPFIKARNKYMIEHQETPSNVVNVAFTAKNAKMFFINTVFDFDYAYKVPTSPKTFLIGACLNPNLLKDNDLRGPVIDWLDKCENVVFIALGTVSKPSASYIQSLLIAFQKSREKSLKNGSVWHCLIKIPKDCDVPSQEFMENVRVENWLDSQLTVLKHGNVKIFISHCGGNSVNEGIYFGKPILAIPQWFDCYDFAQRVQDSKIGLRVFKTLPDPDYDEINEKLWQMIDKNGEYKLNVDKISASMIKAGGSGEAARQINNYLNSES